MKKALSLTLAAAMALSSSICVFAEGKDEAALTEALTRVKERIEIPAELEEFNYRVTTRNLKDEYTFEWTTPSGAEEYRYINARICSSVITSFETGSERYWSANRGLAQLSADELYKKAVSAVKMLNPTVAGSINVDKDSLYISLSDSTASFSLVRTKNGIPVKNNRGNIVIDKNTGELIMFYINWHVNASFKSAEGIISEGAAQDKYAEMIELTPQYEIYYDSEADDHRTRLVYVQDDSGEINAYTGSKSDFTADGYYADGMITEESEAAMDTANPAKGAADMFTKAELAELNKELPYGTEKAVAKLMSENEYLTYDDNMELYHSNLYKNSDDRYIYSASFTSVKNAMDESPDSNWEYYGAAVSYETYYEEVSISVDAESGEIISYSYYTSEDNSVDSFDSAAMEKRAETITEEFAGDKLGEYEKTGFGVNSYTDKIGRTTYSGSYSTWQRRVNDIRVSGDNIRVNLNGEGTLTGYNISRSEVDFISPEGMLTADEVMDKFWEKNDIDLYYLARVNENKTKTVLVYGTDSNVYCDAFTGGQVYDYSVEAADFGGISSKQLRNKAEILDNHGLTIGYGRIDENAAVTEAIFAGILNRITEVRLYSAANQLVLADGRTYTRSEEETLTNGDAMIMFAAAECGSRVPQLEGVFKSPYTDVTDSDKNVGYYAIAHALTGSDSDTLNESGDFTYGDMIELVYGYLAD